MNSRVVIIGIDGSGKSTISKSIQEKLETKGLNVETLHYSFTLLNFFPRTLANAIKEKGHKISQNSIELGRKKHINNKNSYLIYPAIVNGIISSWLDYFKCRSLDYVIHDRYYYDSFFHYTSGKKNKLQSFFISFISKPEYIIYLDIEPQIAYLRKKENSIEELSFLKSKYELLFKYLKQQKIYVIDATIPAKKITEKILDIIHE